MDLFILSEGRVKHWLKKWFKTWFSLAIVFEECQCCNNTQFWYDPQKVFESYQAQNNNYLNQTPWNLGKRSCEFNNFVIRWYFKVVSPCLHWSNSFAIIITNLEEYSNWPAIFGQKNSDWRAHLTTSGSVQWQQYLVFHWP